MHFFQSWIPFNLSVDTVSCARRDATQMQQSNLGLSSSDSSSEFVCLCSAHLHKKQWNYVKLLWWVYGALKCYVGSSLGFVREPWTSEKCVLTCIYLCVCLTWSLSHSRLKRPLLIEERRKCIPWSAIRKLRSPNQKTTLGEGTAAIWEPCCIFGHMNMSNFNPS